MIVHPYIARPPEDMSEELAVEQCTSNVFKSSRLILGGNRTMGISLLLLASGLLLAITGVVLLVIRKHRKTAVSCLILGITLILVPPMLIIMSTM